MGFSSGSEKRYVARVNPPPAPSPTDLHVVGSDERISWLTGGQPREGALNQCQAGAFCLRLLPISTFSFQPSRGILDTFIQMQADVDAAARLV